MSASPASTILFVYGTLMRGDVRAPALAGQQFLGPATTQPRYRLVDCGDYPGLIEAAAGVGIEGELYAVDAECLRKLDLIEGVDEGLYERRPVLLDDRPGAGTVAYFYLGPIDDLPDCGRSWRHWRSQHIR